MEGFEGMKRLEEMMSIFWDNGIRTNITERPDKSLPPRYTITFLKAVNPVNFFILLKEISVYFDWAGRLLPAELGNCVLAESIPPKPEADSYTGIILEPKVKKDHEMYSAVVNALENVLMAAEACRRKYEKGREE